MTRTQTNRARLAKHAPELLRTATRCARTGDYARATRMARSVALLAPAYPTAWNLLADLYWAQGQPLSAAIALRECLRLDPSCARAHATLGELALRVNVVDRALEHLTAALREPEKLPPKRRQWTTSLLAKCAARDAARN